MTLDEFNTRQMEDFNYIQQVIKNHLPTKYLICDDLKDNHLLGNHLLDGECLQKKIFEAMEYSLLAGGKRLRPMLMLLTYRMFGGDNKDIIEPFMTAIEMIHTYSLVHDDLPAMDNDEYRRGRKTTHIVYGEALGILAGDALLNYAFETAAKTFEHTEYLERTGKAFRVLSKKAGIFGMIGGQVVDMEDFDNQTIESLSERIKSNRQNTTPEEITTKIKERLDYMYHLKTGALLEASMMIGAILAGADEARTQVMERIAAEIGIAFQIQDDILDIISTTEELGKPVHSDAKNSKITYVSLMGIEKASNEVIRHSEIGKQLFKDLKYESRYLIELINSLISRRK
ncbi:MAG: Geranylgeranyl pyrophosphate synthase [Anaerocolumna sp.]|jgi:geranylgeranyl diphosphate synthase type II|nr:Geranylgeranyl pyrophosphate synthase [Anaerocolumna sp.]